MVGGGTPTAPGGLPSTSATSEADAALGDGGGAASPAAGDARIAMLV